MTEPICPVLVTASILETTRDTFNADVKLVPTAAGNILDVTCCKSAKCCVPLEVFLFKEQDEFPELALILLHQSITTNLKETHTQR